MSASTSTAAGRFGGGVSAAGQNPEVVLEATPELQAAVILTARTGVRQGELFGLTADRVMWLRRELDVDRQRVTPNRGAPALGPCKTAPSVRTVPIADHALAVLSKHVEWFGPGPEGIVSHRKARPWPRKPGRVPEELRRLVAERGRADQGGRGERLECFRGSSRPGDALSG